MIHYKRIKKNDVSYVEVFKSVSIRFVGVKVNGESFCFNYTRQEQKKNHNDNEMN